MLLRELTSSLFSVKVENLPETQKVEIVNPQQPQEVVEVSNLIDNTTELKDIVNTILEQTKQLKSSPDNSATKKQLLTALKDIKTQLSKPVNNTKDVITHLKALGDKLNKIDKNIPIIDLKPLQNQIEGLKSIIDIDRFVRNDEVKVYINEKQVEKLSKTVGKSLVATGGGNISALVNKDFATETTLALIKNTDGIKKITDPVTAIAIPYAIQYAVNSGDSTITYVGKAATGSSLASAVWQIKKITDTSGDLSIQFADGNTTFDNIWDNRESLSYS